MDNILNIVNDHKDDVTLYNIIFNTLTKNNHNYTTNKNGVWFNLKNISKETIDLAVSEANNYLKKKLNNENLELERTKVMHQMKQTINSTYRTDLKKILSNNKILSSRICLPKTKELSLPKRPIKTPAKNSISGKIPAVYVRLSKIIKSRKQSELYDEEYDADKKQIKKEYPITSLSQITKKKKKYSSRIINTRYMKEDNDIDELSKNILNLKIDNEDCEMTTEIHDVLLEETKEFEDDLDEEVGDEEAEYDCVEVENYEDNDSLFGYDSD